MEEKVIDITELAQDTHNFNKGTEQGQELMERSFKELGAGRSILVDKNGNIIAGNKSQQAAIAAGIKKVRVIETTGDELVAVKRTDIDIDSAEGRRMALLDNLTTQVNLAWDPEQIEAVSSEIDGFDPNDYGFDIEDLPQVTFPTGDETEEEAIERKRREFEEKMAAGELDENDPEYQEFVKKFEAKRTTDDCYTPDVVYDAVAEWVASEYNVSRANFVRPFYPGGDYQKERYKPTDIVVDNPPFSIMSEILKFYKANGIKFFLFGPHLTLFSNTSADFTCLPIGVPITYKNGANVNTSFVTNMEPEEIRFRSEPRLYAAVKAATMEYRKEISNKQADYAYDKHLFLTSHLCTMSLLGYDFKVTRDECELISKLHSQEGKDTAIFGHAYIVGEAAYQRRMEFEKERAQLEAKKLIERAKEKEERTTIWPMSDVEWNIIKGLK